MIAPLACAPEIGYFAHQFDASWWR